MDIKSRLGLIAVCLKITFPDHDFSVGKGGARMVDGKQCSPTWGSIFVTDPDGMQIGRILFSNGEFSHFKVYGVRMGQPLPYVTVSPIWDKIKG